MNKTLRVAIAQINSTVGDFGGNFAKVAEYMRKAKSQGADIVVFPELAVTGYPPEDLLLKARFIDDNLGTLKKIAKGVENIVCVIGFANRIGKDIYNAAAIIYNGHVKGAYHKMILPNYGVFDEKRYFKPGADPLIFKYGNYIFGVNICEDIWHKEGPMKTQVESGANLIININSSPYHMGKIDEREEILRARIKENKAHVVYANLIGGQDELVFDGHSFIMDPSGRVVARAEAFKEDLLVADLNLQESGEEIVTCAVTIDDVLPQRTKPNIAKRNGNAPGLEIEVYSALVTGLKDYVAKNSFKKVVIGMSGGIDSSLVAALAADALGAENVNGVYMPTRYSSEKSEHDAKEVAANLGIDLNTISIDHIYKIYLMTLDPHFAGKARDIAEENIQARIRGNIMMALSNKFGWLVLTTGNKSEMSTGYATLYGDMAGGFAVIKDVPKMLVYKLAKYRNTIKHVIPESVFTKEPTAELRPEQKDRDTLPPYNVLDPILKAYVEEDKELDEIVGLGFDKNMVAKVMDMVDKSEYKRRQSPPGIRITPKAFGKDRRMPITCRYR